MRGEENCPRSESAACAIQGWSEDFTRELLLADDIVADVELLVPFNAFAVYRKRS